LNIVLIESLLRELVESVDGATGALVVALDGEAVQSSNSVVDERLRLRSAYVAVVMQTYRACASKTGLGNLKHIVVDYKGAILIAQEVDSDCSVVLELRRNASIGHAVYQIRKAAAKLRDEIGA